MEFCHACNQRYMPRLTSIDAKVVFECEICHRRINGLPEDTLWYEEARVKEDERFQMYLERAGHDLAGKTVAYEDVSGTSKPIACSCGRQYMTLVRVGKSANTLYVCECGIVINAATGAQIPRPNDPTRADGRAFAAAASASAASASAASASAKK